MSAILDTNDANQNPWVLVTIPLPYPTPDRLILSCDENVINHDFFRRSSEGALSEAYQRYYQIGLEILFI